MNNALYTTIGYLAVVSINRVLSFRGSFPMGITASMLVLLSLVDNWFVG